MRISGEPAYILHQRPYSETSLLLELWTLNYGRVAAIAKGAKRNLNKRGNAYVLFRPVIASWSGKNELVFMNRVEPSGVGTGLEGESLLCGFYMNELIMYMFHRDDPHPGVFAAYETALRGLGAVGNEPVLRKFEKQILAESGYGLVLDHDIETNEPLDPEARYDYHPEQGPVRAKDGSVSALDSVRIRGKSLLDLNADQFLDAESRKEIKSLIRLVLKNRLQGKEIRSRELFLKMKSFRQDNRESIC